MDGLFVDEGRIPSGETAIARRPKPQFLTVGEGRAERKLCSTGRFHPALGADYLLDHRDRWIPVGELSRIFYGANTPTGKDKIRRRLSDLFNHLLVAHRVVLLYEFDGPRIASVKIFDDKAEQDRQAVVQRIDRMARRCRWTQRQYELVQAAMRVDPVAGL